MRLWQKLYLFMIIPILLVMNLGIYLLFYMTYEESLEIERTGAQGAFVMICDQMYGEMEKLSNKGELKDKRVANLVNIYEGYFNQPSMSLAVWKNDVLLYPEENEEWIYRYKNKNLDKVSIKQIKKETMISMFREKKIGEDTYVLGYSSRLAKLDQMWIKLRSWYVVGSFSVSILSVTILAGVLNHSMKKINRIIDVIGEMEAGDLSARVSIHGKDEIDVLGAHMNQMADTIEDNVEQMKMESENKQWFIDNLAHEMKTPITGICGFVEYLQMARLSEEEQFECLEYIKKEAKHMQNMSQTLLHFAIMRNTKIICETFKVSDFVEELKDWQVKKYEQKEIEQIWNVELVEIYGNRELLILLVRNLLENAFHAIEQEGTVCVHFYKENKHYVIEITDSGCGMEEKELERIREPFYRVDKSRSRNNGGTGLGIALCEQIVECHKGTLTYQSKLGEGTKVKVKLPYS